MMGWVAETCHVKDGLVLVHVGTPFLCSPFGKRTWRLQDGPVLVARPCITATLSFMPAGSEMGTSFSPCGRYLAVCVISDKPSQACAAWLQQQQSSSPQAPLVQESLAGGGQQGTQAGANTSTGHGPSRSSASGQGTSAAAEQQPSVDVSHSCTSSASSSPTCELRVYAVWGPRFGEVLAARPIRAADCLTSLQFSPTSE
jgi:hypothetical protein